ncbi:hypothetical protein [Candidatus Protochlamydia phocaeensis]|uniref:hypothetical protein n=1 Tax=Candidatus Protochlamydia phocaeensis TaxID=1414722 RepID=UPI000838F11D|nr:hypothetical protein [Candidatus Protochlamydia phocaeensis]
MCDAFWIEATDLSFFHANHFSCHMEKSICDLETQDASYFYYEECPCSADQPTILKEEKEQAGLTSKPAKNTRQIIPDYLLKKVQDYHEREGAEPAQVEKDRHDREESEKMRQYRQQIQHPAEALLIKNKDFDDDQ